MVHPPPPSQAHW